MSSDLFEVTFSGKIEEGKDLESVRQLISKIFKADEARLEKMFSGQRVMIKRQANEATANKYRAAFKKAGAICDVTPLSIASDNLASDKEVPTAANTTSEMSEDYSSKYPESDIIPEALIKIPLDVTADQIQDLDADVAPAGSQMQDEIHEDAEPSIDISGIDVAPVGSQISTAEEKTPPAPPDISGITMAD